VVIWTTTPWTLPANQAVSLGEELDYVLVQLDLGSGAERLVFAEALLESVLNRYGVADYKILGRCKGKTLEGKLLQHPFYDKKVPVLVGDHVTTDTGTGAVHTAPDHGMDDFVIGKKYNIGTLNLVDENGVYRDNVELFAGKHVYKVDPDICAVLKEKGALILEKQFQHSFPHCWRTKTPLIFRATPQWFISMNAKGKPGKSVLETALDAVNNVEWIPSWGQARIEGMLAQSPDWCVSRQRTWGAPIALFIHKKTQTLHPRTQELVEQIAQLVEKNGMDAWFDLKAEDLLGAEANDYDKVTDTLDVWFDSGVTHEAVLRRREELHYPADLYLEGSDQHRGWFQSSLKTAIAINGNAPYKQVLTHGFTVDAQGRKMSKSVGNVVAPQKVMDELGADVLRLWVAATDFSGEMTVSDEILKRTADSYRRIRNTARFLLSNLNQFDPALHLVKPEDMLALDRWAVERTAQLQTEIIDAYNRYQLHLIYQKLHNFCVVDLGGFYLDIIKDRQYTCKADSLPRRSCQTALFHIIEALTRWLAPILSFTADELWQVIPGKRDESIFVQEWYQFPEIKADSVMNAAYWQRVMEIKTAVNKVIETERGAGNVGSSLQAEVTLYCNDDIKTILASLSDELRFVLITSYAGVFSLTKEGSETELTGLRVAVKKSDHKKCVRCWHYREDVGTHKAHEELCGRCVDNIEGAGEVRKFA
jgi:isoleucyl-tRNA synthetase